MLSIDDYRSNRFVSQIDNLYAEQDEPVGMIYLSSPDQGGSVRRRELTHAIEAHGYYRDKMNRLLQFIIFFDELNNLSGLQILNYHGIRSWEDEIDPELILVSTEAE